METRGKFSLGGVIAGADKGINTSGNIYYNCKRSNGYVFSQSVMRATRELKEYIRKDNGYEWFGDEYKRKSKLYPHKCTSHLFSRQ